MTKRLFYADLGFLWGPKPKPSLGLGWVLAMSKRWYYGLIRYKLTLSSLGPLDHASHMSGVPAFYNI